MKASLLIDNAPPGVSRASPRTAPARSRALDAIIIATYLLVAFGLYRDLWLTLPNGYLTDSGEDQKLFEWFFAVQAQAVAQGHPVLFTALQNHPAGVNLMANTAMPGLAVPLAPLTLLAGPSVTWAVVLTGGLAGTAVAWYWVFSRRLTRSQWAAAVGGACCAFTPPVVSHAHAHPNFTATFLLPVIALFLLRLCGSGARTVRDGLVLGGLVGWQVLVGEEPLLIFATGCAVWALAFVALRPRAAADMASRLAAGLGVAGAVAGMVVAYPLWVQFAGPASYHALEHGPAGNDLANFVQLPKQSIGGQLTDPGQVVANPTEQNAFLGWPLMLLVVAAAVWLRRELPARLAVITFVVLAVLSAGGTLIVNEYDTGIPGPWLLLQKLPLYESLLEARLVFACLPALGVLLALATDRAMAAPHGGWFTARRLWPLGLVVAALPILPVRFIVEDRPEPPAPLRDGGWRELARPGRTIVPVPLPAVGSVEALHWQVLANLEYALPEGYFVGPIGPDRQGTYGAERRPTSQLLEQAAKTVNPVPAIGQVERDQARADLRYWQADSVVLPPHPRQAELRAVLDALLGRPGQDRGDTVVWDVRDLTG
ncbi:hypothetical protein BKA01_001391 [Pseudonocardia eucalypti]|uniref:glycosyl transferase n=1 Tax=Pseudonocardia eucalypti TaxID=648755 RepID=UPI0017CF8F07|nr:hypothetical protein [Pseudonocardia eucalypti]